jgi:hypothetical protein
MVIEIFSAKFMHGCALFMVERLSSGNIAW